MFTVYVCVCVKSMELMLYKLVRAIFFIVHVSVESIKHVRCKCVSISAGWVTRPQNATDVDDEYMPFTYFTERNIVLGMRLWAYTPYNISTPTYMGKSFSR